MLKAEVRSGSLGCRLGVFARGVSRLVSDYGEESEPIRGIKWLRMPPAFMASSKFY